MAAISNDSGGVALDGLRAVTVKEYFFAWRAVISMLLVQAFRAGLQLLSRVILVEGTFVFSLLTYRHIVAALCIAPFALYFERGYATRLGWSVWFWVFVNALLGTMTTGVYYYGLLDTSATYSVNFLNLVPIVTFLVSITFRMEKLRLRTWADKIKTIGIVICVGGALISSLYRGQKIYIGGHHSSHTTSKEPHNTHMVRGTLFCVASCFLYAGWYIVQVKLLKALPLNLWATTLTCLVISIQAAIVGLCKDNSKASWSLGWNMELLTIVYSGVLASAATYYLVSWIGTLRGPTYPPMFNPLSLLLVALFEGILLDEPLTVGLLVGMVFILAGLYGFLWGKSKETHELAQPNQEAMPTDSATEAIPSSSSNIAAID